MLRHLAQAAFELAEVLRTERIDPSLVWALAKEITTEVATNLCEIRPRQFAGGQAQFFEADAGQASQDQGEGSAALHLPLVWGTKQAQGVGQVFGGRSLLLRSLGLA